MKPIFRKFGHFWSSPNTHTVIEKKQVVDLSESDQDSAKATEFSVS